MALPQPVVPASEVSLVDHAAQAQGCDILCLMRSAGAAVAELAAELAPRGPILVACGAGNNGGDGYVAARCLAEAGREVWCWAVADPKSPLCDQVAAELPDTVRRIAGITEGDVPALIIDAILGAGVTGRLRPAVREALAQLRSLGAPCLAVDLPTGLDEDEHLSPCSCCCLGLAKREVMGRDDCTVMVADIGIPRSAWADTSPSIFRHWPLHSADAHKGGHGSLAVVAGWAFPGAGAFACRAALAAGCDLVHAWMPEDYQLPAAIVHHRRPRVQQQGPGLRDLLRDTDAVLLGPGLGRDAVAQALAVQVWEEALHLGRPLILDADALVLLSDRLDDSQRPDLLLTPHKGELAAITGDEADETAAHALARPNRVALLKGRRDFISDGLRWQHNHGGNPRLCVGGTGDCLAGLAAGLWARGCDAFDAARMAVYWLCLAGDTCWQRDGCCFTPEDVLAVLPETLHAILHDAGMPWPPQAAARQR